MLRQQRQGIVIHFPDHFRFYFVSTILKPYFGAMETNLNIIGKEQRQQYVDFAAKSRDRLKKCIVRLKAKI